MKCVVQKTRKCSYLPITPQRATEIPRGVRGGGGGIQTHFLGPKLAKPILQQTNKGFRVLNSTNVVYLIHCKKCNLKYVGSTTSQEFKVGKGTTNHL